LQLAALSMQGHRDIATFIEAFTSSLVYVAEYLLEEILKRLPASRRVGRRSENGSACRRIFREEGGMLVGGGMRGTHGWGKVMGKFIIITRRHPIHDLYHYAIMGKENRIKLIFFQA
jgi:hypothetical protein